MVFAKTRGLYKYMHSQWTRIHCSDGRWRETPKALYYNHLPAAYLTFASPSVFVFLFVLKPAFAFLIILFEFVILLQPSLQLNILYLHLFLFFFLYLIHPSVCIWSCASIICSVGLTFAPYLVWFFYSIPIICLWRHILNHSNYVPVTVSEELFHPREEGGIPLEGAMRNNVTQ